MKLYGYTGTRSTRVHWMLEELAAPYEHVKVEITKGEHKQPEHVARHPHGLLPAAELEGEKLIESTAMCLELADRHLDKKLAPPLGKRAHYYEYAIYAVSTLDPTFVELYFHLHLFPPERRDAAVVAKLKPTCETAIKFLTGRLGSKTWLLGEFSAADVIVGYDMALAAQAGLLKEHAALGAYAGRCAERPAFRKAFGM